MADGSTPTDNMTARLVATMADIDRKAWDRLANPARKAFNPFIAYDFLDCLEQSNCVGPGTGWHSQHLVLEENGELFGAVPLYAKSHSQGEYIFDHAFANAYQQAGGQYYPKLLAAIPFTPATGPRFLADDNHKVMLAKILQKITTEAGWSSLHVNFLPDSEARFLQEHGYTIRIGEQFHFTSDHYNNFEDFLSALASRKRKQLRKERRAALADGITIDWVTGRDITEAHLDQFWQFYQDTGQRKWGSPYLTRNFFSLLNEKMSSHLLFIFARRGERIVAGAMNMIGGDTLYGRYWGCTEYIPYLHFELCYYQAIDFALAHGLTHVEAGAQGEHKLVRGYVPKPIWSAHWFASSDFHSAIDRYLAQERAQMKHQLEYLSAFTPFKKT
ncbi:MAG: GNAT family N-acetyltransferase [bacterium]